MNSIRQPGAGDASLAEVHSQLQQRVWHSALLLATVLTPLSLLRATSTGWLPIYTVHAALFACMLALAAAGSRVTPRWRVVAALGYLQIAGTLSVFLMGFMGFGFLWLVANSYLIATLHGHRAGLISIAGNVATMLVAMYGFKYGVLDLPVAADAYMRSDVVWMLGLAMIALFPWTLLHSVGLYKEAVIDLLNKTEQQRQEIERLATHDHLTGLVQQRVAMERLSIALQHARRSGNRVGVLFLDLDGFKRVNDEHGHAAGDHVLRTTGNILRSVVRESDTVARLGGDEFLVILEDLTEQEVAASIASRVLHDLARPIPFQNALLHVGTSIGIALFPEDGSDAFCLREAADGAMYAVKRNGKGGYAFAGTGMVQRPEGSPETGQTSRVRQLYYE